jgi:predicted phosphodiesterase
MSDECGCAYKSEPEKDMGKISISFTNSLVNSEERRYLRTLPAHIKVEFQLNNDRLNLLLVHGSPRKINEYLFEDREERILLRIMEGADADIMCFGHTHKPYHRILVAEETDGIHYRHAINIGSVGKPKDNNPMGCYVIFDIDTGSSIRNKDAIKVDFVRFEYDVERAAKAIEESPLPNEYAEMLRKGF